MKKITVFFIVLFAIITTQAKIITSGDAMNHALKFCEQFSNSQSVTELELAYTNYSNTNRKEKTLYVFNKPEGKGFVVVSADNVAANLILGYTDNGIFDYEHIPEGLKWLLSYYSEQIDRMKTEGKTSVSNHSLLENDSIIIPPLLGDLQWNQFAPFNNQCPKLFGEQCIVGCVATSMTSLMYYYKWPLTGQGQKSYKYMFHTFSADFSKSTYDWSNILPRYIADFSDTQAAAVAKLSADAGISVEMQYGAESSNSHLEFVQNSLAVYFKYNSDILLKNRTAIMGEEWNKTLKNELNNLRPVCYCGENSSNNSHAFICDGYTKNNYFHFNFGWNGQGDGYYLSSLDDSGASASGVMFSSRQLIVYNAQPDNKYKVNGLYYHLLSPTEAEVCSPVLQSEYVGDIIIPSTVTINGTNYLVTRIGCAAFGKCTEITSLTLPESIKLIEGNSIFGCSKLQSITVPWLNPLTAYSTTFFEKTCKTVELKVPIGSVSQYTTAVGWNQFAKITEIKPLKGDANNDGIVDVADITIIASYILNPSSTFINYDNADVNSDKVIDVADITATAGIILKN